MPPKNILKYAIIARFAKNYQFAQNLHIIKVTLRHPWHLSNYEVRLLNVQEKEYTFW
jgi:hypothetical protein